MMTILGALFSLIVVVVQARSWCGHYDSYGFGNGGIIGKKGGIRFGGY
ncbi:hypothetical protein FSP39_016999 [Pinctada imbricata]|uniref:Uncharacterized protein n=1 Tax=Pinctada imbricata TaxID=66713 RepID=A0AA89BW13_PINIB|nr:hypothetical protein FSP39_016999 [Pinctada imbricata]